MTEWYQKAINALQLNGLGERTQEAYVRALRMLCEFYHKTPDQISESELQQYFLHRKNRDRWSPNTMRICYCGIRFFFLQLEARLAYARSGPRTEREAPARRVVPRGGARHPRLRPHTAQPRLPLHRLRLRSATAGSPASGDLRYR